MILEVLFGGLLQGGLIVAVTYVVSRCISDRSAATRYALWFAALWALVLVPVLTVVSDTGARLVDALRSHSVGNGVIVSLLPAGTLTSDVVQFAAPVTAWIVVIWVTGAVLQCCRLLMSFIRIQQIRKNATTVHVSGTNVLMSTSLTVPIAVGIRVPAVILPEAIVKTHSRADLERIIAHELAHIRRMDVAGNFAQRLVEAILFFNPWVFVIGHELSKEREAAADDWAVMQTGAAADYAQCLASLAQSLCGRRVRLLAPSALGSRNSIVARIERVVRNGAAGALALNYYAVGGLVIVFALLTIASQAITPVSAAPSAFSLPSGGVTIASACTVPTGNATLVSAATPAIPDGLAVSGHVDVLLKIAPTGRLTKATIMRSSGNARLDAAVLSAATASTYAPAHKDCRPVSGTYVFRATLSPAP